jgi:hypothetical protein
VTVAFNFVSRCTVESVFVAQIHDGASVMSGHLNGLYVPPMRVC